MNSLKAAALYFALVFGAGFGLGTLRVLWAVPRFGERTAELLETPLMFVAIILAACWVVRKFAIPPTPTARLGMGLPALAFLLTAELTLVLWLRGITISEYIAGRDPVSGTVYLIMLGVFGLMPLLVGRGA